MTLREAAQQALEALEDAEDLLARLFDAPPDSCVGSAMTRYKASGDALRTALYEDAMQRFTEVQQQMEAALKDQATYGMSITLGGKRIDPAAIYKEREPVATVTSEMGNSTDTMSWWHEPALPVGTKLYTAPPAPTWTQAHWTEYERGIVATERERIAAWVEDMCAGLDAKTIANGIRNGGNDDIRAFEEKK